MRDWNSEMRRNRDVLTRIVALLVALADLADLASGLSARRRRQVLEILMCGEAEAFAFVMGMAIDAIPLGAPACDAPAYDAPAFADEPEPEGDPARIAASLRMLALALWSMLAATRRLAPPGMAGAHAVRHRPADCGNPRRQAAPPAPDTS